MNREKLLRMLILKTYFKVIEIPEEHAIRQVYPKISRDAVASRRQVHERKGTLYMPVAAVYLYSKHSYSNPGGPSFPLTKVEAEFVAPPTY